MFNIIPCKLNKWHFYSRWLDALTKSPSSFRLKREDGLLQEDGCTMHITGLATFFLALNIRAATEIWNTSVPISPVYRKWNYTHISSLCIALFSKTFENFRNDGILSKDYQASENKAQSINYIDSKMEIRQSMNTIADNTFNPLWPSMFIPKRSQT